MGVEIILAPVLTCDYHTFKPQWKRVKFNIYRRGYEETLNKSRDNNNRPARMTDQSTGLLPR